MKKVTDFVSVVKTVRPYASGGVALESRVKDILLNLLAFRLNVEVQFKTGLTVALGVMAAGFGFNVVVFVGDSWGDASVSVDLEAPVLGLSGTLGLGWLSQYERESPDDDSNTLAMSRGC